VRTKRLTEGVLAAERRAVRVPARTGLMTSSGTEENERTEATCTTALVPAHASRTSAREVGGRKESHSPLTASS
jgi:hypothetical protein